MLNLSIARAYRIGAVLGLSLSVKAYPGERAIRDSPQAKRLLRLTSSACPPLTWRAEVPLPVTNDHLELRSRDLVLFGHGERTGVELESRLYDLQAQLRRYALKQRDDPVEHFLLVVADTRGNRCVLREYADLLAELPSCGRRRSSRRCGAASIRRPESSCSDATRERLPRVLGAADHRGSGCGDLPPLSPDSPGKDLERRSAAPFGSVCGPRPTGSTQFSDLDPPNPSQWRK